MFSRFTLCQIGIRTGMASGGNGSGKAVDNVENVANVGGLRDGDQGTRVQRDELRQLEQRMDLRFRRFEERFDEIAERLDALSVDAYRRQNNRQPRVEAAHGDPVVRPVRRQVVLDDDDDSEDEVDFAPNRFGRNQGYRNRRDRDRGRDFDDDRDSGNFRLKVDILYFNGGLGIEEFLDWIAEIERFFDYMDPPQEKRVKLVACRLKGLASAWWERIQNRSEREGKGPVQTWYRMKHLLQREFLPADYEQILFQQFQRCQQGGRSVHEYTSEFMRLAERNNLHESKGQ